MSHDRKFIPLDLAQRPFFAGVDLGGTNIKVGLIDDLGRPLAWHGIRTDAHLGPKSGALRMGQAVLTVAKLAGVQTKEIARVGLGSPGTMDIPAGILLDPPNLPGWTDFPIREEVSGHCGLPVTFANDAASAAYGEFWVGSGREYPSLVLFTLGTGVGCGIIVGDLAIDGEHSHGAECGHITIDFRDDARLCSCGQRGHLESYCSATAVVKRAQEDLLAGRQSRVSKRVDQGEPLTTLLLAEEAEAGDPYALELILDTARVLGVGVVNLMHTIDPACVLIGGAMTFGGHETALGRRFLERIKAEVARRAFPVLVEKTVIDYASLGGDAGYIGVAGLARLEYQASLRGAKK